MISPWGARGGKGVLTDVTGLAVAVPIELEVQDLRVSALSEGFGDDDVGVEDGARGPFVPAISKRKVNNP